MIIISFRFKQLEVQMDNVLLGLLVLVIFRVLFKKFGTLPKEEYDRKNKAIKNFMEHQTHHHGGFGCSCFKSKTAKHDGACVLKQIQKVEEVTPAEVKEKVGFDDVLFLKSVETAATLIIDAFNNNKLDELGQFCSANMFDTFKRNIELSMRSKVNYKTVIVSFLEKSIIGKKTSTINNTVDLVSVKLKMEQINYVENEEGHILQGSRDDIRTVNEVWTFELADYRDNVWILTSITEDRQ
jgi:predicted lipid-binding transport protein (Tim44 family)